MLPGMLLNVRKNSCGMFTILRCGDVWLIGPMSVGYAVPFDVEAWANHASHAILQSK